MQLKLTTDYAVRTLLYLAKNNGRMVSSAEIAGAMHISRKYLMKVCSIMRDAGIVLASPGTDGGYSLAKLPEEIRLYDVVRAMETTIQLNRCLEEDGYCNREATDYCTVHKCYAVMQRKWENFLKGISIADLVGDLSEGEIERRIANGNSQNK